MQPYSVPRERQPVVPLGHVRQAEQRGQVYCRVQQGGMHPEPGRLRVAILGQAHLGEELVPALPGRSQPLERGAVPQPRPVQRRVGVLQCHRLCRLRWPGREVEAGSGRPLDQHRRRVAGPSCVGGGAFGTGVDLDGTVIAVGGADAYLDVGVRGQHEGCFDDEFFDGVEVCFVACAQGEFEECGAGDDDGSADGVVGEPGVGGKGEAAGEQHPAVPTGQGGGGAEQGMAGRPESQPASVAGPGRGGVHPEAFVLEGVGGEVCGGGLGEEFGPVGGGSVGEGGGGGGEGGGDVGAVFAEDGCGGDVAVQDVVEERGEDAVGTEFQVCGGVEGPDGVMEPDRAP